MNEKLNKYFFEEAAKSFAFLCNEYSFAPPELVLDEQIAFATVLFKGRNLAVQCILDHRDEDISCKIARVMNGRATTHYARDENGVLVRDYLSSLVRRKGVTGSLFTKVAGLPLEARIPITLEDFARMLQQHGREILTDSPSALSEYK